MSTPTPLDLAKRVRIAAVVDTTQPAKALPIYKAAHVKPGMKVQAFLHGEARGSVRTIDTVERVGDVIVLTFSSKHPSAEYKPAYRFVEVSQ